MASAPFPPQRLASLGRQVRRGPLAGLLLAAIAFLASPALGAESAAEALVRQGRIEEGIQAAAEQAVLRPDDMDAHELYIDLLLNIGYVGQARATYAKRVQLNPLDANAHYLLGRATVDARAAKDAFEKALRIDPAHARSHMGMGAVHLALNNASESESAYGRATSMDPSLVEAWMGRIRARLAAGDLSGAVERCEEGLKAIPNDPNITYSLVTLDPTRAPSLLPAAIAATPDDAPLREALAIHLLASGQTDEALEMARTALVIDSTRMEAQLVAWTAAELAEGRIDRPTATALQQARQSQDLPGLDAVVAKAPRSVLAHLGRAQARKESGANGVLDDLKQAYRLDATHSEACAAYGKALLQSGKAAEAVEPLACAANVRPWDVHLQIALAQAEVGSGLAAQGMPRLHALAEARPTDVVVVGAYAQILVDSGQADKAYNLVKRAMARVPDPRLGAAFVMVAVAAGHRAEAADFLEDLANQAGNDALKQRAQALRAGN